MLAEKYLTYTYLPIQQNVFFTTKTCILYISHIYFFHTGRLIFRLMMSEKSFVIGHYANLILSDETKYHILGPLSRATKFKNTYINIFKSCTMLFQLCLPGLNPIFE